MTNAALQNTPQNTPVHSDSDVQLPPVRELTIEGIKKQDVIETRLAYLHSSAPLRDKPAETRKLAKRCASQVRPEAASTSTQQTVSVPRSRPRHSPASAFRLIETKDVSQGIMMAAKAIGAGLATGEVIAVVSFHKPEQLKRKLEMTGLDMQAALDAGKLVILDAESLISADLSREIRYQSLFVDIQAALNLPLDRIVILEMDRLVDLDSQHSAYLSVSKFTQAADETGAKVIAQYVRKHTEMYDRLDAAASSVIPSYFVMSRDEQAGKYRLASKNHPV